MCVLHVISMQKFDDIEEEESEVDETREEKKPSEIGFFFPTRF